MKHQTTVDGNKLGWFDDERGSLGGKRQREALAAAVKDVAAKERSLAIHLFSDKRTDESIQTKQSELERSRNHLGAVRETIRNAWDN